MLMGGRERRKRKVRARMSSFRKVDGLWRNRIMRVYRVANILIEADQVTRPG